MSLFIKWNKNFNTNLQVQALLSLLAGRAGRPKKGKDEMPLGFPILAKDKHIMFTKLHVFC